MLKELTCYQTQLTSLDVSSSPDLVRLRCHSNLIIELDVTGNPALTELWCTGNPLTELNITNCPEPETLYCGFTLLTSLDLSHNTHLNHIVLESSPDLADVCVWELPFPPAGVTLNDVNCPNIEYNTDCFEEVVYIPDANFKAALIDRGVDISGNGEIGYSEAGAVDSLDVNSENIIDLTGIEAFTNIAVVRREVGKILLFPFAILIFRPFITGMIITLFSRQYLLEEYIFGTIFAFDIRMNDHIPV